jgi:hypothetical protein
MTERTGRRDEVLDVASVELMYRIEQNDAVADDDPDQPGRLGECHEPQREDRIVEHR